MKITFYLKRGNLMGEYSNHRDQLGTVTGLQERLLELENAFNDAFKEFIFEKQVKFIAFGNMNAEELARAFIAYPIVIKSVLTAVNVAGRAIKRDLDIDIDTYKSTISAERASILAGYIKPLMPNELSIPALIELDRWFFVDKELRKGKGNWEKFIVNTLNDNATVEFKKTKFYCDGEEFELDAAYPAGGNIEIGIDIKRIESKRDIHKRADEIVNKAAKLKRAFPSSSFFAVIYYPFTTEHINVRSRLNSDYIDGVYFATELPSSIEEQSKYILGVTHKLKNK